MKFFLENWYLFLAAAVSGGLLLKPLLSKAAGGSHAVSTAEAVRLINREKAVLIDVNEADEFASGHASGSKSVPLSTLETSTNALPKNKALPLVVLCATGVRSGRAVPVLNKLGHANVHTVSGGLVAWRQANLPVEKTAT